MQTSAARAASAAASEPRPVGLLDRAARLVHERGVGQLAAQAVEERRDLDAEPELRVARHARRGWRTSSSRGRRAGRRRRARRARSFAAARERQRAVVVEQDHGGLGELARDRAVRRRVEVERTRGHGGRLGRPVRIEQPELGLLAQHAPRAAIDELLRHRAGPHQLRERLAVVAGVRELDVDARLQRQRARLADRAGDPVHDLHERDRPVVRDDDALEAPLVAQHAGQQRRVGRDRQPVDVAVGVHDRARAALPHRHLERRQQHVAQRARPDRDRRVVAGRLRRGVAREVLQRRDDATRLQPAHVRACRSCRPGRGPRRASPRRAPSGSRARRRARARGPGGRRPRACSPRSRASSARRARGRRSPPTPARSGRRWRGRW